MTPGQMNLSIGAFSRQFSWLRSARRDSLIGRQMGGGNAQAFTLSWLKEKLA